jgi:hypothetical protein
LTRRLFKGSVGERGNKLNFNVISGKSMGVRPESVTHLVVKLFNVKSKFDYIDNNNQKSEIANNDKFEKRN